MALPLSFFSYRYAMFSVGTVQSSPLSGPSER